MRSTEECWRGREEPSKREREEGGTGVGRAREGVRASPFLSGSSQRQVCFPGANTPHQRGIAALLHGDALQLRGSGGRESADGRRAGPPNNRALADD